MHLIIVSLHRYGLLMELRDALRGTGSVRDFTNQVVEDQTVAQILDDARFAPSGGNRQSWRVIVVRDQVKRRMLRDLYLDGWHDYVAHNLAGLVPFSPLATHSDRELARNQRAAAEALSQPEGFPERLDSAPVLLVICADLSVLAAVDRDLGRYQIAGGASVYPFVWQILLAARERGIGGVMTTIATRHEPEVCSLFDIPDNFAVASVVAMGYATKIPTKLRRRRVEEFTTLDSFSGEPLAL